MPAGLHHDNTLTMADINGGNDPLLWMEAADAGIEYKNPAPPSSTHLAYLDIEATHYDPKQARILEIAILHDRDGAFEWKVKPTEWDLANASKESLKIVGYNEAEWADAPDLLTVMRDVARVLRNAAVVAYNGLRYDIPVLSLAMDQVGLGPRWHPRLAWDPYYTLRLLFKDKLDGKVNLDTVCEHLGLEPEGIHRAMGGATRLRDVCNKLKERMHG